MTSKKPRKLHQLIGTIQSYLTDKVTTKGQYQGQSYYLLTIQTNHFFYGEQTFQIYAFPNLVQQWERLKAEVLTQKPPLPLHFYCEKRVRGWRLRAWQTPDNSTVS